MTRVQYVNCRELRSVGADYQHRSIGRNYHNAETASNLACAEAVRQQLDSELETLLGYYKQLRAASGF